MTTFWWQCSPLPCILLGHFLKIQPLPFNLLGNFSEYSPLSCILLGHFNKNQPLSFNLLGNFSELSPLSCILLGNFHKNQPLPFNLLGNFEKYQPLPAKIDVFLLEPMTSSSRPSWSLPGPARASRASLTHYLIQRLTQYFPYNTCNTIRLVENV